MCGIVGIVRCNPARRGEDERQIAALTALMVRRGPDDVGTWSNDDDDAVFGFRRLSIIDVSAAGHQPMISASGRHVLVYNGELYNFRQLRAELEAKGRRFRSASDTEVVLEALVAWGPAALERFNGMFALAFYDADAKALLLARDPIGIKPLYYLEHQQGVLFASQFDQVMAHPWRGEIDPDGLQLYLRFGYVPPPWTMIRNARMLQPGHFVMVRAGAASPSRRFFDWPEPAAGEGWDAADASDRTSAVLADAVSRQMTSDVPLGVFLSAGVDSPLVAAVAADHSASPLDAFTIGSTDASMDESREAALLANDLRLRHVANVVGELDACELVTQHAQAFGEPFADHSSMPTLLVSQLARERVTVALSGDGGDELFFGYPRFAKVLGVQSLFSVPTALRTARYAAGKLGLLPRVPAGVRFPAVGAWYLDSHSYWHQADLDTVCPDLATLPSDFTLYDAPKTKDADELARWLRRTELEGHLQRILLKVDRASMFHSLEVRVPLLDLDVVSVAFRIPHTASMTEVGGKAVLRALLAEHTNAVALDAPKRGFTVPVGEWLRTSLRPHVEDLLLAGAEPAGVFDLRGLRRMFDEHCQGRDRTLAIFAALSLQLWWQGHGRTVGA